MAQRKKKPENPPAPPPSPSAAEQERPVPDPDSIVSEKTMTSPKGTRYRVIETTETDEYEEPAARKRKRKK